VKDITEGLGVKCMARHWHEPKVSDRNVSLVLKFQKLNKSINITTEKMLNIRDRNPPHDEKQSPSANQTQSSMTEGKSNLEGTIRNLIFPSQQPFSVSCSR